jgi:hypothetical protein
MPLNSYPNSLKPAVRKLFHPPYVYLVSIKIRKPEPYKTIEWVQAPLYPYTIIIIIIWCHRNDTQRWNSKRIITKERFRHRRRTAVAYRGRILWTIIDSASYRSAMTVRITYVTKSTRYPFSPSPSISRCRSSSIFGLSRRSSRRLHRLPRYCRTRCLSISRGRTWNYEIQYYRRNARVVGIHIIWRV